jgi:hypothetical protein
MTNQMVRVRAGVPPAPELASDLQTGGPTPNSMCQYR